MIYLLKFKRKENPTLNVQIGKKYEYREFDGVEPIVRFVHENAAFIKEFTIRKIEEIEKKKDQGNILVSGGSGCISLQGENSEGLFY